jgi:nitrite reductase (NO-forming)
MFVAVYPGGDAKHAFTGVSAYPHCARPRRHLDAILSQPGKYPIIDHSRRNMAFGAVGELKVTA